MQAVIMAGGFGTRLRPLTANRPKPMVPVGGVPLMEQVVRLLKKHGFIEAVALVFYQAEQIKEYFKDGKRFGLKMAYQMAEADYGTAGSVKNAANLIKGDFLVISADVLTDIDLTTAVKFHENKKASATIVLSRQENPLSYGIVLTDETGKITRFLEKPSWGQVFSDTVNTGIYVLNHEVLDKIPDQQEFDFSQNLFPKMLADKEPLFGYVAKGYWKDVGNIDEYFKAHADILAGKVEIEMAGDKSKNGNLWIGEGVKLNETAETEGTVCIGVKSKIGPKVFLKNSILSPGVAVEDEARIENSIIWEKAEIGKKAKITGAIVGAEVRVGEEAEVEQGVLISDEAQIGAGARLAPGVKIWPGKKVEEKAVVTANLVWGEKWNRELFTDSKVTGLANLEITPEFVVKLGAAFGSFLGKNSTVITSRDASPVSRMINRAGICGLLSAGASVEDLRQMPIPVVRFLLKAGKERGGIFVRHAVADLKSTDIVFFDQGGMDLPIAKIKAVERLFFREDFPRAGWNEVGHLDFPVRVLEAYRQEFLTRLDLEAIKKARFKVVIDYSYGSGSEVFPSLFGSLGIETISLNSYPDVTKFSPTEEAKTKALAQLSSIVRSVEADLGLLVDPGAERIDVVDSKGAQIDPDRLLLIVTEIFMAGQNKRKIAVPVVASMGVEEIAQKHGASVERVGNDHLSMMKAAREETVGLVGGTKGGFIFPEFQVGADAMFSAAKILELLAKSGKSLAELAQKIDHYNLLSDRIPCAWGKKGKVMRKLMSHSESSERQLIDGVRILGDGFWILGAPDRREAYFNLFVEAKEEKKAKKLLDEYKKLVEDWQK
ncbi:MAG TPA: sugar phosphate nucleotidyltransferase [Verrucomicrobiae bacterium]|nr:sugar phosphate nucleotidyltransferase [Verrucomicrobiae bacterium]